ncbi:protein of unknown function [Cupriavidus taiwanensis]|nr:protein of unknown function [Cupriavidus taiwanensis]
MCATQRKNPAPGGVFCFLSHHGPAPVPLPHPLHPPLSRPFTRLALMGTQRFAAYPLSQKRVRNIAAQGDRPLTSARRNGYGLSP